MFISNITWLVHSLLFTSYCVQYKSGKSTQPHAKYRYLQYQTHSTTAWPASASRAPNARLCPLLRHFWCFLPSSFSILAYSLPGQATDTLRPPLPALLRRICSTEKRHSKMTTQYALVLVLCSDACSDKYVEVSVRIVSISTVK